MKQVLKPTKILDKNLKNFLGFFKLEEKKKKRKKKRKMALINEEQGVLSGQFACVQTHSTLCPAKDKWKASPIPKNYILNPFSATRLYKCHQNKVNVKGLGRSSSYLAGF